ncbi:MAG: ribosome biogenesis/translation initiation ATPase RLI [archaeon]
MRIAILEKDKCINGKGCNFVCGNICPVNRSEKDCIILDSDNKPVISEELCIGCGICVKKCPAKCILIENLVQELKVKPLHQFGVNAFRLYNLPLPSMESVVGLIGENGVGKTTALNILSGKITPNLGNFESKPEIDNVISFFKGRELQAFFKNLKEQELKLAVKPQQVQKIKELFEGKTIDLLKSFDEKQNLEETIKLLELEKLLDLNFKTLSGGELQRIAIAITLMKQADIYFFDEPTTFLDISQRLKLAGILRKLVSEKKRIILVEHDLAVLDYLSDYVYVLYGKPAAYGIVSNVKTVRNGINEFLAGFLKDENLRFRKNEILFNVKPPSIAVDGAVKTSYPVLEKSFESFTLKVEAGALTNGEVTGILGPNATGKTTFVRMLAGLEKPDNTELNLKNKIAFKPQNLEFDSMQSVQELFYSQELDKNIFNSEVERRLKIKCLFERKLGELSGGELQRVFIAITLCKNCKILLLDEPSAFLDLEQRLLAADAIKSVTEKKALQTIVVDHDLLFLDYLSNNLIVFSGQPSVNGSASKPLSVEQGMNAFLKQMNVTFRRDETSRRPRANKPGSLKDREQKEKNQYYYTIK